MYYLADRQIDFTLSDEIRELFHTDKKEFISQLIEEIESTLKAAPHFFNWDCNESGETIDEDSIDITDVELFDDGTGKAHYWVNGEVYRGCRDIDGTCDHDGSFKFFYHPEEGLVEIPYREEFELLTDDI